jgi:1-phosphatidylinositol phosphodiesterase
MTYHDNDIYFSITENYALINAVYTVDSFSVTKGQDPDHEIHAGLVVYSNSSGMLTFRVGRSLSKPVAEWFKKQVTPSQTTFDQSADELHFAFMGTLRLSVTGGILGKKSEIYTFSNVVLAQGHSGGHNNWWFGGQTCSHVKGNKVTCTGVDSKGKEVMFVFGRGDNDVSTVKVTPTTLIDTANWMKYVDDTVRLDRIVMPGSHDAGMSELHHCAPPAGIQPFIQTQSSSIGQQLKDGSRYFDIRVDYDHGELVTYHRKQKAGTGWGCNGQSLLAVLNEARAFFIAHPTETAIFKFSHTRKAHGHDPNKIREKIDELLNDYNDVLYTIGSETINLAKVNLGRLRGKMVLVFDYSDYNNASTGRFRYMDGETIQPDANITVFDDYTETADLKKMAVDQITKLSKYGGLGNDRFFLLSWTLTPTFGGLPIDILANDANAQLPNVLSYEVFVAGLPKPNIVFIDYLDNPVAQSVILYNFW